MSQASGYQGAPGTFDTLNPTIIPNLYTSNVSNGVLTPTSPAQAVLNNPRVAGTNAVTVGGTSHAADVLTVTISNNVLPGGAVSFTHTVAAGPESLAEDAQALAAACNANSVLQQHDIYANSYDAVVTINQLGPLAAFSTVTTAVSGSGHTTTLSSASSGKFSGGSGVLVPLNNATVQINNSTLSLRYMIPVLLAYPQLQALVAAGVAAK